MLLRSQIRPTSALVRQGRPALGDTYRPGTKATWLGDDPNYGADPRVSKVAYLGAPQTVRLMAKSALEDCQHFETRKLCEAYCERLDSKDYTSEYLALYYLVLQRTRYMRDPKRVELVRAPWVVSGMILDGHIPNIDCLPGDTLLLKKGYTFAPIKDVKAGDEIWGYNRWSKVDGVVYKGILPVDTVFMNNGSSFSATADHKVYIKTCEQHPNSRWRDTSGAWHCQCEPTIKRIPVSELCEGMVLVQPGRLPFGDEEMDPDRAYIDGLYISDGWHQATSFAISGQDGCPKEEQKREVQAICERLGIETTWYRKSIYVFDKEWAKRTHLMGGHAPEKRALSINLGEGAAGALLRGIMADSGKNTHGGGRTFTTTSHELMLQTRVLHKMFAVSCGERYITNHGGLGKNPIWRLQTRHPREDGKATKHLRVKAIEREVLSVPVYDIQTDDHYVYLPHADVTVSNCDDASTVLAAGVMAMGGQVSIITVAFADMFYEGERQYSHVLIGAKEPRSGAKIILDPVAAENTASMLRRVKAAKIYPITG